MYNWRSLILITDENLLKEKNRTCKYKKRKNHHQNDLLTEIILKIINSNCKNLYQFSLAQRCFIFNDTILYVYFAWLGQSFIKNMETIYFIKWLFKSQIKTNRMNFAFFSDFNSFREQ